MATPAAPVDRDPATQRLLDENEQLRTAIEAAWEENGRLAKERDRAVRAARLHGEFAPVAAPELAAEAGQGAIEEELRVALEELQVLTEELEGANTSLHETNMVLDARVEARTRRIFEINEMLRSTEAAFRAIADLVPDLLWRTDAKGRATWFNARWSGYTGQVDEEPLDRGWLDAVHPDDRGGAIEAWERVVATGGVYQHEFRIRDAGGRDRWFLVRAEAVRDQQGGVANWFVAGTDINAQREAMAALQRSEARFRTLIEGMPPLAWRATHGGQWTWCSPRWTRYTNQGEAESRGLGWLDMIHPDDRDAAMAAWARTPTKGVLEMETRIFHAQDGRYRHFRTRALPVRTADGRIVEWLGTSTDVDDIVQLHQHQDVLVSELQHRTRNLMAVVQAVTMRTLKGSTSLTEFRACIDDRLQALARVQGLLSQRDAGRRVQFDTLLREELSAHVDLNGDGAAEHVTIRGPAGVPLHSSIVQTLALALHELATNAVKYGALSRPGGHLCVEWGVTTQGDARRLWVDWRETGVTDMPDLAAKPRGGGYGRELIERALPYQLGAQTSYAFEADGVHCTIDVLVPDEGEWRRIDG